MQLCHCIMHDNIRNGGKKIQVLTKDHKPEEEKKRITDAGGQIYQTTTQIPQELKEGIGSDVLIGPYRVFPGRLSVSRTIGDPEAKMIKYGGNPNVIIAVPDIVSFKITDTNDFIVMGCDGIFDQLSNEDVIQCVWNSVLQEKGKKLHQQCANAVDSIIKNSLMRQSLDNVTCIVISFSNFKRCVFPEKYIIEKHSVQKQSKKKKPNRNKSEQREFKKLSQITLNQGSSAKKGKVNKKKENCLMTRILPQSAKGNKVGINMGKPKLINKLI